MLISCPECSREVSDKAVMCPGCGYPIKPGKKIYKAKKVRLPNGFGRITKLSDPKLRKPYRAMITVGTSETGKPIGKLLKPEGYFKTYNEAYMALMEYHKNPFNLSEDITVKNLFDRWTKRYYETVSDSRRVILESAWKYCDPVKDLSIKSLKASHVKMIMEDGTKIGKNGEVIEIPLNMKENVKSLFIGLLDYALEADLVDRNFARNVSIGKDVTKKIAQAKNPHIPYTEEELKILWEHVDDDPGIIVILIQCYSGWRPGEMAELKVSDTDLTNWTFTGGNKTVNGKNRTVPIHSKIQPLVKKMVETAKVRGSDNLLFFEKSTGRLTKISKDNYENVIKRLSRKYSISESHRPHDGRVTFVTLAKNSDVDEYAIKRVIGHSISDITEKVYTVRDIEWLRKEIERLK